MRSVGHFVWRLGVAVALGMATVFSPKARHDDHWSTPPNVVVEDERQIGSGWREPG